MINLKMDEMRGNIEYGQARLANLMDKNAAAQELSMSKFLRDVTKLTKESNTTQAR